MKNKKTLIILFVIILFFTGIGSFLWAQDSRKKLPEIITPPTPTAEYFPPAIRDLPINDTGVTFSFSFLPSQEQLTLPRYFFDKQDPVEFGASLANRVGITSPVKRGPAYSYWSQSGNTVTATYSPPSFSYTSSFVLSTPAPTQQETEQLLNAFLSSSAVSYPGFSISSKNYSFFFFEDVQKIKKTPRESSNKAEASFSFFFGEYPIFLASGAPLELSASFTKGELLSLSGPIPPKITKAESLTLPPVSFIQEALPLSKGSLFQLTTGGDVFDVKDDSFSAVNIRSVSIVYIVNNLSGSIDPFFLAKGIITAGSEDMRGASVDYLVSPLLDSGSRLE